MFEFLKAQDRNESPVVRGRQLRLQRVQRNEASAATHRRTSKPNRKSFEGERANMGEKRKESSTKTRKGATEKAKKGKRPAVAARKAKSLTLKRLEKKGKKKKKGA
eukprot:scaffold563_cov410-Prasinococcus_capsulatus_cf.AAC.16